MRPKTIFRSILGLIYFFYFINNMAKEACGIIFSFDRPLQLQGYYDSLVHYVKNVDKLYIIYRTSSQEFQEAYQQFFSRAKSIPVYPIKQSFNARADFKTLTMQALHACDSEHIFFAVDDLMIKDFFDIDNAIQMLENTKSYAFFLRLGRNITDSYMIGRPNQLPAHALIDNNVMRWQFNHGIGEWFYPHSVDMVIYKKMMYCLSCKH